jgi:mycoredoxin
MKDTGRRQYLLYLLGGACGVLLIIAAIRRGTWLDAVIGVAIVLVVLALSPPALKRIIGRFPQPVDAEVIRTAPVVIYWRPLSPYCARLREQLGRDRRKALWVNIWRDPDAAAMVRGLNNGDELVPTVIVDGRAHANPDPTVIRAAVAGLTT